MGHHDVLVASSRCVVCFRRGLAVVLTALLGLAGGVRGPNERDPDGAFQQRARLPAYNGSSAGRQVSWPLGVGRVSLCSRVLRMSEQDGGTSWSKLTLPSHPRRICQHWALADHSARCRLKANGFTDVAVVVSTTDADPLCIV
eukprot:684511-Rhodomonas_salina.1